MLHNASPAPVASTLQRVFARFGDERKHEPAPEANLWHAHAAWEAGFYDDPVASRPIIDRHQALMWEVGDRMAEWEALLEAATGVAVRPGEVGDSSPEAKARGHSVELNLAGFDFMGDRYVVVDCPGSLEFCAEIDPALPAVDLAIVVAEPDPAKAGLLQPTLRELERLGVPHALFINKMDQAHGSLQELLGEAAQVAPE